MEIIINTEKKYIKVPSEFKEAYDSQVKLEKMLGKDTNNILSVLDIENYKIVPIDSNRIKDKINKNTIEEYMKKVKETDKTLYEEYKTLKEKEVGKTKSGKPIYTSFLVIKKWFYSNFPDQNPFKKQKN